MAKKFCLRRDEDCHWYLLPYDIETIKLFNELIGIEDGWGDSRWCQFDDCRIDDYGSIVFENPIKRGDFDE